MTTLPSDSILLGEIKKTVSRSEPLPEKNFTSNVFLIGTKIYGSKTDSTTVYVQFETTEKDKYSIYKTTEQITKLLHNSISLGNSIGR